MARRRRGPNEHAGAAGGASLWRPRRRRRHARRCGGVAGAPVIGSSTLGRGRGGRQRAAAADDEPGPEPEMHRPAGRGCGGRANPRVRVRGGRVAGPRGRAQQRRVGWRSWAGRGRAVPAAARREEYQGPLDGRRVLGVMMGEHVERLVREREAEHEDHAAGVGNGESRTAGSTGGACE
jgi:hypothetical protein